MLKTMPTAESEVQDARGELERVLASTGFSRNERIARFLRFIVEEHLEGSDSALKESVIAVKVFGRTTDHDPKQDSIVRTEAGRLRARLSEYYVGEGKGDELVIELPKGGYTPVFASIVGANHLEPNNSFFIDRYRGSSSSAHCAIQPPIVLREISTPCRSNIFSCRCSGW